MAMTSHLDDFNVDADTKQVLDLALEMTRTALGLADDFANGIIGKRIIELSDARLTVSINRSAPADLAASACQRQSCGLPQIASRRER